MTSNVSFRIPRVREPRTQEEANITRWQKDLTQAINMLVDSVNSLGGQLP